MSKPFSIRTEPWASFDRQSYSIVSDDFVHDKLLTVKINQKPLRGGLNLKNQITKKGETYKTLNEIKIWFPILSSRNGALYFRSRSDDIKIHYDDNLTQIKNSTQFSYYNFYASYQTQKNFKNAVVKAGINLIGKNYSLDNRVRVGLSQSGDTHLSTGHKISWAQDNCLTNHSLVNNAIRVGYRANGNELFLRAHNETARNAKKLDFTNLDTYFTNFIFDYVRKIDDLTRIGFETSLNRQGLGTTSAVIQRSIPGRQSGIKAKISTDKSLAICYQAVINNYGKWTVGWQVSDLGKTNKSLYGVQFDLNL